jgi:lipid II:glycine glycyltransferase (peptidoglycan interpeptide bridge formation enzyme)
MIGVMNAETWNQIVAAFPEPHLLQTWQWGQMKAQGGWQPLYKVWGEPGNPAAASLLLQRTISIGGFAARLRVMYAPKGPLLRDWGDAALRGRVLADLRDFARQKGAIFLKIDPDVPLGRGLPGTPAGAVDPIGAAVLSDLQAHGWCYSEEQIQFRNTVLVDLRPGEDEILARMKQKTRYNIRLAARKGVTVRPGGEADLPLLYRMYAETSLRDGFTIRGEAYYLRLWKTFMAGSASPRLPALDRPFCQPLIAEVQGEPVAALVLFVFGGRAYYLQGMSRGQHREKMPTYLLQWEAMRQAKSAGCSSYDLWGAPDVFDEGDALWGVYRFKEGLGGEVLRTLGAYDLPLRPTYYRLYQQVLPRVLDVLRRRGRAHTSQSLTPPAAWG